MFRSRRCTAPLEIAFSVVGVDLSDCQEEGRVSVCPELSSPCPLERNGGMVTVIMIINLMAVTKVHAKGVSVHKIFFNRHTICILPFLTGICTLQLI